MDAKATKISHTPNTILLRVYRYRLKPTMAQEEQFRQFAGVCRLVYNLGLEQRLDHWRAYQRTTGKRISYFTQSAELTKLRAEFDWIEQVPATCAAHSLRDLDYAFQSFFRGGGLPSYRRKGRNESFRFKGVDISVNQSGGRWGVVRLPKIGWVKFRDTRDLKGEIRNATVKRHTDGWYVSFAIAIEHEAIPNNHPVVGIDRGIAQTLALSNGEMLRLPDSLDAWDRKLRRAQKTAARKQRGSMRHNKAMARSARLAAKRARIRYDWHHRATAAIAGRFSTVVLEDLRIKNMMASGRGKRGLNRSIANQGWHIFEKLVEYKLIERGGALVKVPAAYSSQTCAECGIVDRKSRKSQATFSCVHCGHEANADTNAAREILRRSSASMGVEGSRWTPDEALTRRSAAA